MKHFRMPLIATVCASTGLLSSLPALAFTAVERAGLTSAVSCEAAVSGQRPESRVEADLLAAREERMRAGIEIVDRVVAAGVSSTADFAAVDLATKDLPDDERANVMARLSAAINAGQIRFDRSRPRPGLYPLAAGNEAVEE